MSKEGWEGKDNTNRRRTGDMVGEFILYSIPPLFRYGEMRTNHFLGRTVGDAHRNPESTLYMGHAGKHTPQSVVAAIR